MTRLVIPNSGGEVGQPIFYEKNELNYENAVARGVVGGHVPCSASFSNPEPPL